MTWGRPFSRSCSSAPEADGQTAQHLDESLERAGGGAVKIAYNTSNVALPLELLNAIREGEIISIQGYRAVANVSQREARLFGETVRLPDGPFMLAFVAQVPIFPLFIVRTSFHRCRVRGPVRGPHVRRGPGRGGDRAPAPLPLDRTMTVLDGPDPAFARNATGPLQSRKRCRPGAGPWRA